MKSKVYLSLVMLVLLASGASVSEAPRLHPAGGWLSQDPHAVPSLTEVTIMPVEHGAPMAGAVTAVDLSGEMPPVGDQGNQGSCIAWSFGYYDKTHTEYVEHGWDVTLPENQVSPAFIYNHINGGYDNGAFPEDALQFICDQGACMWNDLPYDQTNCDLWPSELVYEHGILYRGLSAYYVGVKTDAGINAVKQRLANGQTCVLGINVYQNFDDIEQYDTVYTVHDKTGYNRGGHGVCIVGYDDSKVTADGAGAFRLVNSWGTGWGNHGYWWMSYYAVKATKANLSKGYVYYASDRIGYSPSLLARVKLTHSSRNSIGISFGIGSSRSPLWAKAFREFQILKYWYAARPFPEINMVFDLSDGASYLDQTESVYVCCNDNKKDRKTGTIDFLSAEYQGRGGTSPQTPVPIPDFHTAAYAKLALPPAFGPQGEPTGMPQPGVALFPNPSKAGCVTVQYSLPRAGQIAVTVLDVTGRAVRTQEVAVSGLKGSLALDAFGLKPGVYVLKLKSGTSSQTRKLVIQ